jgi:hypothetical protein
MNRNEGETESRRLNKNWQNQTENENTATRDE